MNSEAPLGLDIGANELKNESDVLYLVTAIQRGIVVQEPYWGRKLEVMQVCVDRERAEELKCEYAATLIYPDDPVDGVVRDGQTLGVDVFRCRVHEENDVV